MCGRFTLQISPEHLAEIFGLIVIPAFPPRYNIAPSQQIVVIRQNGDRQNRLDLMRWGLIPPWADDMSIGSKMINARSETVHETHSFRHAIRHRRCLIPASGFYEWVAEGKTKKPLYIHMRDGSPMVFAGLWERWKSPEKQVVESCTILTTSSNSLVAPLHERMPVILHPQEYNRWLDREITDPAKLQTLYQPYPADMLNVYEVSTAVNSPRIDLPDLILPIHH